MILLIAQFILTTKKLMKSQCFCCRWAVSTLMSRQNTVPSSDNPSEIVSALIPIWDMFNHHSGRVRYYYNLFIYEIIKYHFDF